MRPIQNNVLYLNLTEILEAGMIRKDYKQRYCSWWLSNKESTCTKKRSWSVFGGLLPVWSTTAFWILGKPLHLRSMLSKLRYTKNCSAYSWHWSTGRVQFFSTMPVHTLHNQCFKSWTNWAVKLCFIYHMHIQCRRHGFNPWVGRIPWRRKLQSTPVFLTGKFHGQRSLVGYSPWGHKRVRYDLAAKQQKQIVQKTSSSLGRYGEF